MTGILTLSDKGQDYIRFNVHGLYIYDVAPGNKPGWLKTDILSPIVDIGCLLELGLHNSYRCSLEHSIVSIDPAPGVTENDWLLEHMSSGARLYHNRITRLDHLSYNVICNGIPLYFDEYNTAAITSARAVRNTSKIPDVLSDLIDAVVLVSEEHPDGDYVIASIWDSIMYVYFDRIIDYGIVAHEATHQWAYEKWGTYDPPADSDYQAAIDSGEPATSLYGSTCPAEDIAEAVRLYVVNPSRLREIAPLRYGVIHRLMTDPTYYG